MIFVFPDTCNDSFLILPMLVKEIEDQRTVAVVGTTEPFLCDIISKLVEVYGKLFIAWNCPEVSLHYGIFIDVC